MNCRFAFRVGMRGWTGPASRRYDWRRTRRQWLLARAHPGWGAPALKIRHRIDASGQFCPSSRGDGSAPRSLARRNVISPCAESVEVDGQRAHPEPRRHEKGQTAAVEAQGGADGVGRATTNTVVVASILVLVSDFFLTKLFYLLG